MRIKVYFSGSESEMEINNQHLVNSYIHKCLGGDNKYHDGKSDYSVSMLRGGVMGVGGKTLSYPEGGYLVVSSISDEFMGDLLIGLFKNVDFCHGMKFLRVENIEEKCVTGWNNFACLSPILLKKSVGEKKYKFITVSDSDFVSVLKEQITRKAKALLNFDFGDIEIVVNDNCNNKVKNIRVHGISNLASQCNVSVKCHKRVAELLCDLGIGQSCGSGFGAVCKVENVKEYVGLKK